MGVYARGMEMPKSCRKCFIKQGSCPAIRKRIQVLPKDNHIWVPYNYRYVDCPLGNVPTPHGRLIDANVAYDKIAEAAGEGSGNYVDMDVVDRGLSETPTIIEAEE